MLKIERKPEPDFWKKIRKKYKNYNDLNSSDSGKKARSELHEFLLKEQKGICAYCCKSINMGSSSNEHIKPRESFPKNSLDYDNLVITCNTIGVCGSAKGNKYCDDFVSPLDDIEKHFKFAPNGKVVCLTESAEHTCALLNLNSYKLIQAHKATLKYLNECDVNYIKSCLLSEDGNYPAYADIIKYYCDHPEIRGISKDYDKMTN